jgi:hypothetical protein
MALCARTPGLSGIFGKRALQAIYKCGDGHSKEIVILNSNKNLGWMGGINYGIKNSVEEFVLFLNDDVKILHFDRMWLQKMIEGFAFLEKVGVVVPTSNNVVGSQHFLKKPTGLFQMTPIVSGMCVLTKRSILNEIGNLDESLSGGDDLDFSLRLRDAGYSLLIRNDVFIYHFGSLTGFSIYKTHWNSPKYVENQNRDLINKHGLKKFKNLLCLDTSKIRTLDDSLEWEKDTILKYCIGKGCEVGFGNKKIKEDVLGVDITPKGERGVSGCQIGRKSQADIDIKDYRLPFDVDSQDYLVSRHVLEHIVDDIGALCEWIRVLKSNGHIIITVPDEEVVDGIPLDPTHKHAYTIDSLKTKLNLLCKYEILEILQKDLSFVFVGRIIKHKI